MEGVNYEKLVIPEDYQEICRTCLNKHGLINLFENKHRDILFSDLFSMFSLLKLDSKDNLPKKICNTCVDTIQQFYAFKERINQSQILLKDSLKKTIHSADVKEEIFRDLIDDTDFDIDDVKSDFNSDPEIDWETNRKPIHTMKKESNDITCPFCSLKFNSYPAYLIHRRKEAESRRKKKPCNICNKIISTYKLKDHLNSHTKVAPYECDQCGEKYRFRSSLSRHKFVHRQKKPHECHICGKGFIQAPTLTDHIRTHSSEKSFICNICGRSYITKHALSNHIYTHRNENITEINDLSCKYCNKTFSTRQNLKQHMFSHCEKEFLCSHCGKKFSTKYLLNHHQKSHSAVKPHVCSICKKGFAQRNSLLKHIHMHSGVKPHVCIICSKQFSQKGHLTYHLRNHSGERPYNCSYCTKTFSHSGSYKVHTRIHTGERPYVCDVCHKGFYDSSGMKKHRKMHESNVNIKT